MDLLNKDLSDKNRLLNFKFLALAFILLLGAIKITPAQDIITKRDNSEMKVRIIEIDEKVIKYKPFDFLEGPLRSLSLSEVLKIAYENGRIENFTLVANVEPVSMAPEPFTSTYIPKKSHPFGVFAKVGLQMWRNEAISDFFGNSLLYSVGIEKQVANIIKVGGELDFTSKTNEDETVIYNTVGAFAKIGWKEFGTLAVYNQVGVKAVFLQDSYGSSSDLFSGIGISLILGVEIPISEEFRINIEWDSFLSKIRLEEGSLNTGSEIVRGGIILTF